MSQKTIHLLAGQHAEGQLIYEQVLASFVGDDCYRLLTSPVFARGAAKGDVIRLLTAGSFEVEQRSGQLCLRVFARQNMAGVKKQVEQELKALNAHLDYADERILVFSIALENGFTAIESAVNKALAGNEQAMWLYANVYEKDGQTPLNWWHDYLAK